MFLPHIPYTSFGAIPPLHHPLYLQPNRKEMADGDGGCIISGRGSVRSGRGSGGGTLIFNGNGVTTGGFLTVETITG